MRAFQALKAGFARAPRQWRVVVSVWLVFLCLALAVAVPLMNWFSQGWDWTVESNLLLERFSLQLLVELSQYDRTSVWRVLSSLTAWVLLAAVLANALLSGGVVASLIEPAEGPFLPRFLRACGLYFGRFLRLLLAGLAAAVMALIVLNVALTPLTSSVVERSGSETLSLLLPALQLGLSLLVVAFFMLALDFARIQVVAQDRRDMGRVLLRSLAFTGRHAPSVTMLAVGAGAAVTCWYGLYLAASEVLPVRDWGGIVAAAVLQQTVLLGRWAVRVGLIASEVEFFRMVFADDPGSARIPDADAGVPAQTLEAPRLLGDPIAESQAQPQNEVD
jgi:hypothetical protein